MKTNTNSLTSIALQKFKKNITGVFSLWFILVCGFIAIFAYFLAPDNTSNANQMHLEIHSKKPGFKVQMLTIPSEEKKEQSLFNKLIFGEKNSSIELPISNYKTTNNALIVNTYTEDYSESLSKTYPLKLFKGKNITEFIKTKTFYLGTDKYGRDLLSRMLIGTRISFFIGFIAVFISLIIGISVGAIAGYFGGKTDAFIMWLINITWSIPTLLLVIAITLALGKGFWQVFIAVGLTMWVEVARVVRGSMEHQHY